MKVYFRTDASAETGTGHLMRCLALAQAFSQQSLESVFLLRRESVAFCQARHDWQFPILTLPENLQLQEEPDWLSQQLKCDGSGYLVLDSYAFDSEYLCKARKLQLPIILFDDNNERGSLPVDVIINGASNAASLGYESTAPGASLCVGQDFRLLRTEFLYEIPQPFHERKSVTIVMGGTDARGLLLRLLKDFEAQKVNVPVRAVLTSNHSQIEAIKTLVAGTELNIQLVIDCQDLANIFSHSLLTISAAGSTQFELLAMQSPSLLLVVADNQENASRESAKQGWCEVFDLRHSNATADVVRRSKSLLADPVKLDSMMQAAATIRSVDGPARILDVIAEINRG